MRKPKGWVPVITEVHRYKIVMDTILDFLHQIPDTEFNNPEKPNFCVKDFSLEQFQWWIGRRMDELKVRGWYRNGV